MNLTLDEELAKAREREKFPEQRLGSTIVQPFTGLNSGNRKIMWSTHDQQKMNLIQGEAPIISTGNENEFLNYSSSYVKSSCNKQVLYKMQKFPAKPNLHYWLIVQNLDGPKQGMLDIIERCTYVHTTESYGFALNTSFIDRYSKDDIIPVNSIIKCPDVVDAYGNVGFGVNLQTIPLSNLETTADGYEVSETAAAKLGTNLYHKVTIQLNDNDIMLNLYGDDDVYKVMPDVGEDIKDGIFLAVRRVNNSDALFSQTWERLKIIMHPTDTKYVLNGTLLDCEIYSNNWAQLQNGPNAQYNTQINYYLTNKFRYCQELINFIENFKRYNENIVMSYRLQEFLKHAQSTMAHLDHYKNGKKYSGTIIEFIVKENLPLRVGDKISNRYGGKGVITKIIPVELMPRINKDIPVEIIMNKSGVNGRLNYGQLFETEINFRSRKFLEHIKDLDYPVLDKLAMIKEYMDCFSPLLGNFFWKAVLRDGPQEYENTYNDFFITNTIRLALRPISDGITIDTLIEVDRKYPWIAPEYLECPIINSNGKIRYVKSIRPCIVGLEYYIRLKQYAKEKESHTSISSVNIKNENSKSKAGKAHTSAFADTPIKMGSMETEDMIHLDAYKSGITEIALMLYSASSEMRNKLFTLYTSDPVHINIELDDSSASRSAEIFHTLFKQLGNEFVFEKKLKSHIMAPFDFKVQTPPPFEFNIPKSVEAPFDFKVDTCPFKFVDVYVDDDGNVSDKVPDKAIPVGVVNVQVKEGKKNGRKVKTTARQDKED